MSARRRLNIFHVEPANHLDICSCAGNFSDLVFALYGKHLGTNHLLIIQNDSQFEVSKECLPLFKRCFTQVSRKPVSSVHHINNLAVKLAF